MASKTRSATIDPNETVAEPQTNGAAANGSEPYPSMTESVDQSEDFGDDAADDSEAPAASETAAALSASVPSSAKPRKNDGKTALALRLTPDQLRKIRLRAMVVGVKPAELVTSLIDGLKEVKISEGE